MALGWKMMDTMVLEMLVLGGVGIGSWRGWDWHLEGLGLVLGEVR